MSDVRPVVNIADVPMTEHAHGDRFAAKTAMIGAALGGTGVGCRYYEVPPGKRAFPFHAHRVIHELFVILEGTGLYRFGPDSYPLRAGDVCAAPPGGPEVAHQIINTGEATLRYFGFSTRPEVAEVVEYPDSGKFGVTARNADGSIGFRYLGRPDGGIDYWDGE
ncbi:MAG: cupin domain-containing protein [Bauldia sp.]|nr:cupin domain-containing protein [Bauldia sp.]